MTSTPSQFRKKIRHAKKVAEQVKEGQTGRLKCDYCDSDAFFQHAEIGKVCGYHAGQKSHEYSLKHPVSEDKVNE